MNNLLYYPYINLPNTDWAIRALLYYDNISSIVPTQYFYEPEQYEPFMREVIQNELIHPINPMDVLEHPWEVSKMFMEYLTQNRDIIQRRRFSHNKFGTSHIHPEKFSLKKNGNKLHVDKFDFEIFHELTQMGLAERIDNNWYNVEKKTANELMTFLTSVIANKIDFQPTTDKIDYSFATTYIRNQDIELRTRQYKRDLILKNLIPYPKQIDLINLRKFKDKYRDLLKAFSNKVELLVLNPTITPESPLFKITLEDMKMAKEELSARMNESHIGDIIFGTICGTIFAGIGLLASPVLGIPGFLNAIHSACKIEKPENIIDQTGLKYLALVDKRLRRQ
jgi:hypothetical protein